MGSPGFLTGGEQKQVEVTMCYFRDEVFTCSLLGPSALYLKDTALTDSLGSKEQATSGDPWDSTALRLQSEVTKETLSHSFGLCSSEVSSAAVPWFSFEAASFTVLYHVAMIS